MHLLTALTKLSLSLYMHDALQPQDSTYIEGWEQ